MQVHTVVPIKPGHSFEFGAATWDPTERSVRNRKDGPTGRFSPRASSEMPMGDLEGIVIEAGDRDQFDSKGCARMIKALAASIERQP